MADVRPDDRRLAAAAVLTGLDAATTWTALHAVDVGAREVNPVMVAVMDGAGPTAGLAARVAVGLTLVLWLHAIRRHPANRWGARPLQVTVAVLVAVVVWNVGVLAVGLGTVR